ncbi:MAG: hypothetical protein JO227_03890 [Acetobacteraceae bacterium]|nr:hypothetical protein [Acetobacteraceae bacterium]
MEQDVFKIFKDLEMKAVGLDPQSNKMQEGYFVAFRSVGLPVHKDDYSNPYSPLGSNLQKDIPKADAVDPKDTPPATASAELSADKDKAFAANVAKSQQSYLNTFLLLDDKLQMNNQYSVMPSSSKVSDSWFAIINGANGIPPSMELNDAMKQAYADAQAKLQDKDGNPTAHYQAYMDKEDEYKSKVKARNKAYADAFTDPMKLQAWPVNGVPYQDDVDEAWKRWISLGFKEEIEKALNTLAAQGTDPAIVLIARAKQKFQNDLLEFMGVGEIPYTLLSPHSWYDADNDDGWTDYTSHDFHSESHYQSSSTSFGGGASFNIGLWHGGASFDHSDSQTNSNMQVKNVKIRFSYCAVDIKRPWLDTSLLNLKNWFLVGDYKKNCISDGTMGQHLPQGSIEPTFLPSVTTSLILVKDVYISWDDWKSQWAAHTESNSGSASFGVGPFTASAHYSHRNQKRDFECDDTGEELHIPGIQLLGYVSAINPPSPQVDSSQYMQKAQQKPATTAAATPAKVTA